MQMQSTSFDVTQHPNQDIHSSHLQDADPHSELKRTYLKLLPPTQIIEICLAFEPHVPLHIKGSVWPQDLNIAIHALQHQSSTLSIDGLHTSEKSSREAAATPAPPMHSLKHDLESVPSNLMSGSVSGVQGSSKDPSASSSAHNAAHAGTSTNMQPPSQVTPYPHQPYGYNQSPSAYPHAPYYSLPPPSPATNFLQYSTPPPPSASSNAVYPLFPPSTFSSLSSNHPNSLFTNAPLTHLPRSSDGPHTSDELPSYEEMIVESLIDSADSEGSAPKNIFLWMASHYPLQSNFRPSASQALQKAYKRGRLEKSNGGKYRLNAAWEGGNTSKRTTRKPQTQPRTGTAGPGRNTPTSSPFTKTPLVHHFRPTTPAPGAAPPDANSSSYTYNPALGYSGYNPPPTHDGFPLEEGGDAWQAAQSILKAINFGNLAKLPEDDGEQKAPPRMGELNIHEELSSHSPQNAGSNPSSIRPSGVGGVVSDVHPNVHSTLSSENRALLQAHLALLAAQLTEISQEDSGDDEGTDDGQLESSINAGDIFIDRLSQHLH